MTCPLLGFKSDCERPFGSHFNSRLILQMLHSILGIPSQRVNPKTFGTLPVKRGELLFDPIAVILGLI
jgi:hypothetical protein